MIKSPLENVNGELYIDGVSTLELAKRYGTPLYVTSEIKIRENYRRVKSAFQKNYERTRVLYSAKANTNLSILKILRSEGAGVDAVSPGEIFLALEAGFKPKSVSLLVVMLRKEQLIEIIK
jgi:diaminopimelate decarboxylase